MNHVSMLLAVGDGNDNVWTGLSGVVLGIMLFIALAIAIMNGLKRK